MDNTIMASSVIVISVLFVAGILNAFIHDIGPNYPLPQDRRSDSSIDSYAIVRGGKTRRSKKI